VVVHSQKKLAERAERGVLMRAKKVPLGFLAALAVGTTGFRLVCGAESLPVLIVGAVLFGLGSVATFVICRRWNPVAALFEWADQKPWLAIISVIVAFSWMGYQFGVALKAIAEVL